VLLWCCGSPRDALNGPRLDGLLQIHMQSFHHKVESFGQHDSAIELHDVRVTQWAGIGFICQHSDYRRENKAIPPHIELAFEI